VPGQDDTEIVQALIAIPGAMIGLALSYFWGARLDREHGIDHGQTRAGAREALVPGESSGARA
jgi:hypothetical protein